MKKSAAVVAFPQAPQPNQTLGFLVAVKRFENGAARVTVEFPSPVSWIALEPDAARAFAVSLQRYADEATSYMTVPPAFLTYYELIERVTRRFPMLQVTREFAEFLAWLVKRGVPKRVLEIGTARGGTAATWCEIGAKRVVSIDLPDGAFGGLTPEVARQRNTALTETYPGFRGLIADSHDVKTVVRARAADFIALLYSFRFFHFLHSIRYVIPNREAITSNWRFIPKPSFTIMPTLTSKPFCSKM